MGTPRAITYKEVHKAVGDEGSLAAWQKVCEITGAGYVPVGEDGTAAIDITDLSASKVERIDALLGKAEEAKAETDAADKNSKKGAK